MVYAQYSIAQLGRLCTADACTIDRHGDALLPPRKWVVERCAEAFLPSDRDGTRMKWRVVYSADKCPEELWLSVASLRAMRGLPYMLLANSKSPGPSSRGYFRLSTHHHTLAHIPHLLFSA